MIKKLQKKLFAAKSPIKNFDINVDNIIISKTKTQFKYLIGYLDKMIRPLVLITTKMSRYIKTIKLKEGNNKLMSFCVDD